MSDWVYVRSISGLATVQVADSDGGGPGITTNDLLTSDRRSIQPCITNTEPKKFDDIAVQY